MSSRVESGSATGELAIDPEVFRKKTDLDHLVIIACNYKGAMLATELNKFESCRVLPEGYQWVVRATGSMKRFEYDEAIQETIQSERTCAGETPPAKDIYITPEGIALVKEYEHGGAIIHIAYLVPYEIIDRQQPTYIRPPAGQEG